MASFAAGQIVIVDWRDALPKEPNKRRPAVVVEDHELFDAAYPDVILVPLTEDDRFVIPDLSVTIEPTRDNGCTKRCHALAHCVTTASISRIKATPSRVTAQQLAAIRQRIGESIGLR
jgi:mRNA interferase MazF